MFSDNILIGLDIGTNSIKMVETKKTKLGFEMNTFGIASHTLDLDGYWNAQRLRQLAIIIQDVMKVNQFSGIKTVMSVMSKDVFVTSMDFDANWTPNQIKTEIERQAPYFLPHPPDEMRMSWKINNMDPDIIEYTGKQRVSIKALPEFVIENSKNLLEHVNLDGVILEDQTESQIRSLLKNENDNIILVDIGARQITFSTIVSSVLRSSSHIPIGSGQISKDISKQIGINDTISESFKKDLHLINLFQLPKPIQDFLKVLRTELNGYIESNKKIGQHPNRIVFTGGGILTPGFHHFFKEFEIPFYFGNPLKNLVINPEYLPIISPIANQFSTAIGLAIYDTKNND
jgi:type IV pilus assembly protein PilM